MATAGNSSVDEGSCLSATLYTRSDSGASLNMGSDLGASIDEGSDMIYEICCSVCEENGLNKNALFFCQECHKCYCNKCENLHNLMYTRHTILGSPSMAQRAFDDQCTYHKDVKLTLICEDHDQLICSVCHLINHQVCNKVELIPDKLKNMHQIGELRKMTEQIQALLINLPKTKQDLKDHLDWMRKIYKEIQSQIRILRSTLNETLNSMEKTTLWELDTFFAAVEKPLEDDIKNVDVAYSEMQHMKVDIKNIDKNTETYALMLFRKCKKKTFQLETEMSSIIDRNKPCIAFDTHPSIQHMITLTTLGKLMNSNNQIVLYGKTSHRLRFKHEEKCCVSGIYQTASGEILLADRKHLNMKLLDKTLNVIAVLALPDVPWSMCSIDSSLVAVAVHVNKVHFIRETKCQLVLDRILKFEHKCLGIAHQQGTL